MDPNLESSIEAAPTAFSIHRHEGRPLWRGLVVIAAVLVASALGVLAWRGGPGLDWLRPRPPLRLTTRPVDEGEMIASIVENGTLESADNAFVRCQVEALLGLTGYSTGRGAVSTPRNTAGGLGAKPSVTGRAATIARAVGGGAGAGAAVSKLAGAASSTAAATMPRPTVRSFSYAVPAYNVLRVRVSPAVAQKMGWTDPSAQFGRSAERPGSTRILTILPEGTRVKAGDVVCTLDSSKFETELKAQTIRYLQAKSWVDQARSILEVNQITLKEYQEGVYPQDVQLVSQYLSACQTEEDRARKAAEWSRETAARGYRSHAQVQADEMAWQQIRFRLRDAELMANRLEKFTAPKIVTRLQAKLEAIRSDLFAQEAAFQLEADRLRRLKAAIEFCTLRAPRDGFVVYHNPPNAWGNIETRIREGTTVRQDQIVIDLPDPRQMRVRAQVNESKVAHVRPGQKVRVSIDAFPDRPMLGTVAEITPIPTGAGGPISDVKVYYAMIELDEGGFEGLRPGLSAEVSFLVEARRKVTRVPLGAVRWVDGRAFVAVVTEHRAPGDDLAATSPSPRAAPTWTWRTIVLGQSDRNFAEVVQGLAPGEQVVTHPDALPPPRPVHTETTVADTSGRPDH